MQTNWAARQSGEKHTMLRKHDLFICLLLKHKYRPVCSLIQYFTISFESQRTNILIIMILSLVAVQVFMHAT